MKTFINRYGSLVIIEDHQYLIDGISWDSSEQNFQWMIIGFRSQIYNHEHTKEFAELFSFHKSINDYKK